MTVKGVIEYMFQLVRCAYLGKSFKSALKIIPVSQKNGIKSFEVLARQQEVLSVDPEPRANSID